MMDKPKKVYCGCEWGQELKAARKQIDDLPFNNPLKNLTDDEIRASMKPLDPTPIQQMSPEELRALQKKNWDLAVENVYKDREQKKFANKEKQHFTGVTPDADRTKKQNH